MLIPILSEIELIPAEFKKLESISFLRWCFVDTRPESRKLYPAKEPGVPPGGASTGYINLGTAVTRDLSHLRLQVELPP